MPETPLCPIRERIGPVPRKCEHSLVVAQGGICAYGPGLGERLTPPEPNAQDSAERKTR